MRRVRVLGSKSMAGTVDEIYVGGPVLGRLVDLFDVS